MAYALAGTMDIDFEDVGAYSEPEAMPETQADEIIDEILKSVETPAVAA